MQGEPLLASFPFRRIDSFVPLSMQSAVRIKLLAVHIIDRMLEGVFEVFIVSPTMTKSHVTFLVLR